MPIDPRIWKAAGGSSTRKLPAVGSLVYYFPQGHAEQSASPVDLSSISVTKSYALCRVTDIDLLADENTDEVYCKIYLDPSLAAETRSPPHNFIDAGGDAAAGDVDVASFSKILTPSDANNGGGFSVPRFCADSIFPPLDFTADPPVQTLSMKDMHGTIWEFRHIFRGTPRRHLLTTGWSKFVNAKRLVAGDSAVFIKNGEKQIFAGIRRVSRTLSNLGLLELDGELKVENGFSRLGMGRVPADTILEAIGLMEMGRPFQVLHYPRVGTPAFVVEKDLVDKSCASYWSEGMKVRMLVENDDHPRSTWSHGTVKYIKINGSGPWPNSPWRMIEVTWDEPDLLQNAKAISPWQVEIVPPSHHMQAPFPAMKKLKVPQDLEFSREGFGNIYHNAWKDLVKLGMGNLASIHGYPTTFPAGMQGARHNPSVPSLSSFVPGNTHHILRDNPDGLHTPEELNTSQSEAVVNTPEELNTSSEAASSTSQESIRNLNLEPLGVEARNPTTEVRTRSFQLFGQTIHQSMGDNVDRDHAENENILSL